MIPPRLIRTIPEHVTDEVERFWEKACELHPDWQHVTYREPIEPAWFPITGHLFAACQSGAQKAGLIRLEVLLNGGGVYIDSDVELYRPLDCLLSLGGFAAWEDPEVVPDAVLAAEPEHPAIRECLRLAVERFGSGSGDWRTGSGAWATGPGVTTTVLPNRDDFAVLPPGTFYPYHYTERERRHWDHKGTQPWSFGAHHWHASWLADHAG